MKKYALIITRVIFIYWALPWIWSFATGSLIRPLHPVNLLFSLTLILGVICVWRKNSVFQLIAGASGVIASLAVLFQFSLLVYSFPSGGTYSTHFGSLEFEGAIALAITLIPPVLLCVCAAIILWNAADEIDRKKEPNQSPEPMPMAVTPPAAQEPRQP